MCILLLDGIAYISIYKYTHTHTHTHIYIYIYIHTHTHTHTKYIYRREAWHATVHGVAKRWTQLGD